VKRQLSRGEAPERLVEALTHFRQDKSSADYYARQTVSRAYVSVALGRGDKPIEIEQKVAQLATHQPHPTTNARQTIAEMKSEKQKKQPGGDFGFLDFRMPVFACQQRNLVPKNPRILPWGW